MEGFCSEIHSFIKVPFLQGCISKFEVKEEKHYDQTQHIGGSHFDLLLLSFHTWLVIHDSCSYKDFLSNFVPLDGIIT